MPPEAVAELKHVLFIYSMTMVRMAAAFNTMPILNKQVVGGAMIRNGIVGSLAIFLYPMVSAQEPDSTPGMLIILALILKEVMIGMFIGFIATIPFWALEAAGFIIDNQRGASMASTMNPMSGSETSPMGLMFAQAFTCIYLISGVFLILLGSLFQSYHAWPVFEFWPTINQSAVLFFLGQFDLIITLSVWLAAPIMICMFITEWGIALISRSAPQLNVFILAMPIKSAVAVAILVLYVSTVMSLAKERASEFPSVMRILGQYLM
ncbi:type III secretion system export apparatus subunit SctT [Sansalvadorimonas verongulae]|uniref:type III secretion system export apparatus subunit SctT n=1 Tax=Sansalvadorimonas verongulae TaxID=2172824 RepID=UPI0012BCBB78|nr:type III secretion system export apparatus subunit SctT [Sansalvadorimonas verongulae]MTI14264.1 EscT/YscT/HrcT family type III secretion system export apparatus protein [Sansalvadorimonas verongulae]